MSVLVLMLMMLVAFGVKAKPCFGPSSGLMLALSFGVVDLGIFPVRSMTCATKGIVAELLGEGKRVKAFGLNAAINVPPWTMVQRQVLVLRMLFGTVGIFDLPGVVKASSLVVNGTTLAWSTAQASSQMANVAVLPHD